MTVELDRRTIERLRAMPARQAWSTARDAVYRSGPSGSEDFQDLYGQLVEEGVLTWDQIDAFDR